MRNGRYCRYTSVRIKPRGGIGVVVSVSYRREAITSPQSRCKIVGPSIGYNTKRSFHVTISILHLISISIAAPEQPNPENTLFLLNMASSGGAPTECAPDFDASCVRVNTSPPPLTQHLMPPFNLELGPSYLTVLAITSAIYLIMVFGIRLFLRLKVNGPFGKDDWACAISTAFGLIYSVVVIVQVFLDLGSKFRKPSPAETNTIAIIGWANGMCLTFAGYFSKVSACYLLARITKTKKHLVVAYVLLATMTLWMIQAQFYTIFQWCVVSTSIALLTASGKRY
jgi:hypothetical protein